MYNFGLKLPFDVLLLLATADRIIASLSMNYSLANTFFAPKNMKNRLEKLLIIAPKLFFQYCQPAQNKPESHILFYKNGFLSDSYIMILSTSMTCACHCILACILCTVHFLYCRSLSGRVFQFCKWR